MTDPDIVKNQVYTSGSGKMIYVCWFSSASFPKQKNDALLLYPLIKNKTLFEEFLKHAGIN